VWIVADLGKVSENPFLKTLIGETVPIEEQGKYYGSHFAFRTSGGHLRISAWQKVFWHKNSRTKTFCTERYYYKLYYWRGSGFLRLKTKQPTNTLSKKIKTLKSQKSINNLHMNDF